MIGVRLLTDYTNHPAYDSPSVVNVDADFDVYDDDDVVVDDVDDGCCC